MQNFNYHTHTYRCGHADPNMSDEDYVNEFIKKGFKKIAFTDHVPEQNNYDTRKRMRMNINEVEEYLASIKSLQKKYKDIIEIETGFEVEYLECEKEYLFKLKKEVDRINLGQHFVLTEDGKTLKMFRRHEFSDSDLLCYADTIVKALELGIPDIIVHPDLYMLGRSAFGEVEAEVANIICAAAEKYNVPIEINLTEPSMFISKLLTKISYPCKEFWEIASNYNVGVLYGVDAHYKEQIRNYEESIDLANEIIGEDTIKKLHFTDLNSKNVVL